MKTTTVTYCQRTPEDYNLICANFREVIRMMDTEMILWIYRTGDFSALSPELSELHYNIARFPEARTELRLKISLINHFQIIGMTYKKPILQQLSIVILCSDKNWQLEAALKEALLVMEEIIS